MFADLLSCTLESKSDNYWVEDLESNSLFETAGTMELNSMCVEVLGMEWNGEKRREHRNSRWNEKEN